MNQFVISVMSRDRVGIIRDVASRLRTLGGNITDLSQTVLRGYFTMILLATFPDNVTGATIQQQLCTIDPQQGPPLEKLEALTSVCSVGLDMIAIVGATESHV